MTSHMSLNLTEVWTVMTKSLQCFPEHQPCWCTELVVGGLWFIDPESQLKKMCFKHFKKSVLWVYAKHYDKQNRPINHNKVFKLSSSKIVAYTCFFIETLVLDVNKTASLNVSECFCRVIRCWRNDSMSCFSQCPKIPYVYSSSNYHRSKGGSLEALL